MSSSRLPGKALLPVGGLPAVVLAARRAGNNGRQVVVATSETAADDLLAGTVMDAGIGCVRGSLGDVLDRFIQASADLPDAAWIVRLTADNVFPDGEFVESALAAFERSGHEYWSVRHPQDDLPYGLSAEITTAGMLRAADRATDDPHDREHVTPWIRRGSPDAGAAGWLAGHGRFRCTLDDAGDYRRLQQIFDGIASPVEVPWKVLCARLAELDHRQATVVAATGSPALLRFCLGTVQLGTPYGVVNDAGQPSFEEAVGVVRTAIDAGVLSIDTARAYGAAETVVSQALDRRARPSMNVVTKLDPLMHLADDAADAVLHAAIDASVAVSCRELGVEALDTLLLHRWAHFRGFGGRLFRHLERLKNAGAIKRLGASVYTPADAVEAMQVPAIEHLQLPFNVVDTRLIGGGFEAALARRADVVIHARSVFLQGLLISPATRWPSMTGVDAVATVGLLDEIAEDAGFATRAQLCVAYVLSHDWAHRLVIGCDTQTQLRENLRLFDCRRLTPNECERIRNRLPALPDAFLDPGQWPVRAKDQP